MCWKFRWSSDLFVISVAFCRLLLNFWFCFCTVTNSSLDLPASSSIRFHTSLDRVDWRLPKLSFHIFSMPVWVLFLPSCCFFSLLMLLLSLLLSFTTWKVSKYGVFSGLYFSIFGLNKDIYCENLRIQSEYGKIRTRITPHLYTFHTVILLFMKLNIQSILE